MSRLGHSAPHRVRKIKHPPTYAQLERWLKQTREALDLRHASWAAVAAEARDLRAAREAAERDLDAALERLGRVSRERDELRATLDAVAAMVRR